MAPAGVTSHRLRTAISQLEALRRHMSNGVVRRRGRSGGTTDRTRQGAVGRVRGVAPDPLRGGYQILGSVAEAEDAVQETWLRYATTTVEPDSLRAYPSTFGTRLSIDVLHSARARREAYVGPRFPELSRPIPATAHRGARPRPLIRCRQQSLPARCQWPCWCCSNGSVRWSGLCSCCTLSSASATPGSLRSWAGPRAERVSSAPVPGSSARRGRASALRGRPPQAVRAR